MDEEEAMDKGVISVTPVSIKPTGRGRINSTRKANSGPSPSLSNSDEKLLPHYLRASTGSCHDFCKYGRQHTFEPKRRSPVLPKFLENIKTIEEESIQIEALNLRAIRKKNVIKLKHGDEVIEKKGSSSTTGSPSTKSKGSTEELLSCEPVNWAEGSSDEPVVIKLVTSSSSDSYEEIRARGFEEPVTVNLDILPPTQKNIASVELNISPNWDEESSEKLVRMLDIKSADDTLVNCVEGSSEKPIRMNLKAPSSVQETFASDGKMPIGRGKGLSGLSKSKKTKVQSPVYKRVVSSNGKPARREVKSFEDSKNMKLKRGSLTQKASVSAECLTTNGEVESSEKQKVKASGVGDRKKGQFTKLKVPQQLKPKISERPKAIKLKKIDASTSKKIITSIEQEVTSEKRQSSVEKTIKPVIPKIVKNKASSPSKRFSVSSKPVGPLKPKTSAVNYISSLISSVKVQRTNRNRIISDEGLSETRDKRVLKPSRASLSPKPPVNRTPSMKLLKFRNTKLASPLVKYQAKVRKGEHDTELAKEKILYVIDSFKPINQKAPIYRSPLRSYSLSSTASPGNSVRKGKKPIDASKAESKMRPRRPTTIHAEDKLPLPHKLKFRRGKIVNFKPDNYAPRRLKFRQVRPASERQSSQGEDGRKSVGMRREVDGAGVNSPISGAPAVVLRHQDAPDKKDTQGLFNHVIEETASKLVEARKSKVKALVSAFETVISLQEGKLASIASGVGVVVP